MRRRRQKGLLRIGCSSSFTYGGSSKIARTEPSIAELIEELRRIHRFVPLYPRQAEQGGPDRAAHVRSIYSLMRQALAKVWKVDELQITQSG